MASLPASAVLTSLAASVGVLPSAAVPSTVELPSEPASSCDCPEDPQESATRAESGKRR